MKPEDDPHSTYVEKRSLLVLLVLASVALGWILWPFYGTIMWGAIIALLFAPLYRWLVPRLRHQRNSAALLTLTVATVVLVIPLALVTAALAREAAAIYVHLQTGEWNAGRYFRGVFDALPGWAVSLLERIGLGRFDAVQRRAVSALAELSQFLGGQAVGIGQDTFGFVASLFIALYLAFFLIRDGDVVTRAMRRAIPLTLAHKRELATTFATVVRATVRGSLLVAAIQGALGGLAFWALGVHAALLWAVLMAFLSLLPAIGAALVWVPVVVYFLVTGAIWQAVALTAWGLLVIGLVDNLLRPILVGRDTRLPDYVVMITTLGGIAVFGINGLVIGPAIAAMFFSVWHLYSTTRADEAP